MTQIRKTDGQTTGRIRRPAEPARTGAAIAPERRRPEPRSYNPVELERRHGRGANINPDGRFEPVQRVAESDGWDFQDEPTPLKTEVTLEKPKTIITRNESPDISFDRSINAYRGCEHGCVYCFARPTHSFQGLSPGLDFETKLFAKANAAELLTKE
ncbi:MAG TPA: hypothetical protein VGD16_04890, partial [Enterovirga sp.]